MEKEEETEEKDEQDDGEALSLFGLGIGAVDDRLSAKRREKRRSLADGDVTT